MTATLQRLDGATITDSANILFEGRIDDGDLNGSIDVPEGGNQSSNLIVSGTTSGVTLKDISLGSGAGESLVLMKALLLGAARVFVGLACFSKGTFCKNSLFFHTYIGQIICSPLK